MPKATDISGTFRVPEEAWGKFWNTMASIPGAEITPNTRVNTPANGVKRAHGRVSDGSTGTCLVLSHLINHKTATTAQLSAVLQAHGKSKKSLGNVLFELKKAKRITSPAKRTYAIAKSGRDYFINNCSNTEEK